MKVGKVIHYFNNIGVAIIELEASIKIGDKIKFEGHGADFEQEIASLQVEHKSVEKASAGDVVGMKVDNLVKEGTEVNKV
ncbi:MAG: hypothetical protein JW740_00445 [Candidatus Zambryskibacteria bacterium]|nr:hypothetical protein [Candidatus Zambryskibacteria bacterium]